MPPVDARPPASDRTWGLARGLLCASPRTRFRTVRDRRLGFVGKIVRQSAVNLFERKHRE
jgi:hypothetical protein